MRTVPLQSPVLAASVLFLLNLYISARLLATEYLIHYGSIEPVFYAIARYLKSQWRDPGWWPHWFGGMPFESTYQPLLHYLVALTSAATGWSEARAFHAVLAVGYSAGAVGVYYLARRLSGRDAVGWIAALLYSLWSPSALLIPGIAGDLGGLWGPQRLHTATVYGDGPHVFGLTLLPLALAGIDRVVERRTLGRVVGAALALIAVPLTNIPAAIGLFLGLLAYMLAGEPRLWLRRGAWIAGCAVCGYALMARWLPLSGLQTMAQNVQWMDEQASLPANRLLLVCVALATLAAAFVLPRIVRSLALRFAILFTFLTAAIVLGNAWFGVSLIGQPTRFHLVMEMAVCLLLAQGLVAWGDRWRSLRWAGIAAIIVVCVVQTAGYRRAMVSLARSGEMETRSEYKISRWFAEHAGPGRVFVPGAASFWLNAFTDAPQMTGCCEQNALTRAPLIANFVITSDVGVPLNRAAGTALAWLRALGVRYVAVGGPASTEPYKPYTNWTKFDGVLPEVWREGDDVIYEVDPQLASLAHFVLRGDLVQTAPAHGADIDPLLRYASAVIAPANTAEADWAGTRHLHIMGSADPGDVLSIQIPFHPGWRAEVAGEAVEISRDALGQMVVESRCEGACSADLTFDGGLEARIASGVTLAAWGIGMAGLVWRRRAVSSAGRMR